MLEKVVFLHKMKNYAQFNFYGQFDTSFDMMKKGKHLSINKTLHIYKINIAMSL